MSYDILFVPRSPGQPWEQALDEAEGRDALTVPVGPERLKQWDRMVEALRRRTGEVDVLLAEDVLEANCGSGLQVSLFADEAALSFPYRERDDPAAFHDLVVDLVGLVEAETGLSAWDAQTDEPFDGRVHDEQGMTAARPSGSPAGGAHTSDAETEPDRSAAVGPDTGPVAVAGEPTTTPTDVTGATAATPDSPAGTELADQRRRALRYLVLGAVIVVVSLLLRGGQEEPSLLSGLALAVGVADLVIGGLMYRSYLRRAGGAR